VGRSDWVAAAQWFTDLEHIQLLRQALCSWSRAARRSVEVLNFCNLAPVIPPARHPGASWKIAMAVVGVVWLGSVALWMLKELDNND